MLTRIIWNSVRKNKGIALMAVAYYLLSVGKKKLREHAGESPISSREDSGSRTRRGSGRRR